LLYGSDAQTLAGGILHQQRGGAAFAAQKYAIITLQFVLFSKTEAQWAQGQSAALVLQQLLHKSYEVQGDAVQKQAVKALCILLKNRKIGGLEVVQKVLTEFVDQKLTQTM